jgi:hypothetical protein
MFESDLVKHLKEQVIWQQKQIELLQEKLFVATHLHYDKAAEPIRPLKFDPDSKTFVPKSDEDIQKDIVGLQELGVI